ncbi:CRAL/TRIO domain protein [Polychaeton citri CBS 116435]|uniref:CRAL/TRIO domain protein n=1 Tax=Polychaeton citri CBS 116435 TaxID=1314669 RepID=A0A9P4Q3M2_9PEZI|nr:CRAL/TRIO domain protein [Polychaeton citri CBS 116435]
MSEPAVTGQPTLQTANGTLGATHNSSSAASFKSATSSSAKQPTDTPATNAAVSAGEEQEPWTAPAGVLKVPIDRPVASAHPAKVDGLTDEQKVKYQTVLDSVKEWTTIPATTAKTAAQVPLHDYERMWLTRDNLLRYLRATKWNTRQALTRLQSTLSWRREYGADNFSHEYISPENETGKQVQLGFDKDARPVLYLNPAKQNTKMSDRQIHHLCYMLDRTLDMLPAGQEKTCLVINFKGAGTGNVPSMGQARAVLNILQGHNPERLGRALISELPWYVTTFFKVISPFIDPVTKEKMKFNEDLSIYIPAEQLWNHHGGDLNFEYDHSAYWPAFDKACTERRTAYRERWEKAGKQIGEHEDYLRGGAHPSIASESQAQEPVTDEVTEGVSKLAV